MPEVALVPKLAVRHRTALAAVLGVITALALWQRFLVDFNGPSLAESESLALSRLLASAPPPETYAQSSSSRLPLHLLGVGDRLGGLLGARLLAAALGLASLGFCYGAALSLFGSRRAAGFGALLVLVAAPHIFLSKVATADVIAFFFFSLTLWLSFAGLCSARYGWLLLSLASVALAATALAQYVVAVHAPLLIAAVAVRRPRLLPFAVLPCAGLLGEYLVRHWAELAALYENPHAPAQRATRLQALTLAASHAAPVSLLALASLVAILRRVGASWRALRLPLFLVLLALPMIALHVASAELASLSQHMAYPVLALGFLAGWGLARAGRARWWVPALVLAAATALGYAQTRRLERAFPDVRPMLAELALKVGPTTSVLSEEAYLLRYALGAGKARTRSYAMTGFDNDGDGHRTQQDVIDAVWDGKPDYVLVHGQVLPELVGKLREKVLPHRYRKVYELPYELSGGMARTRRGQVELWRRNGVYKGQYPL